MPERPSTLTALRPEDVHAYVARTCFKTGPPGRIGVELEWLVVDPADPAAVVPLSRTRAAVEAALPLPHGSLITYEPGGQLELSSLPAPDLSTCWRSTRADVAVVTETLARAGLRLLGRGLDPVRSPVRQRHTPRYDAMATFFASRGPAGAAAAPWMMCASAAVQVCVDAGADAADIRARWSLTNDLGPVLVAMFANSPVRGGRDTGFRSGRHAVWDALDPGRTRQPHGVDPVEAWTRYAFDAHVIAVPDGDRDWLVDPGFTFGQWLDGHGPRAVTEDDVTFHLSTLFPPVRPRGWFEIRPIDAQDGDDWAVPLAVVAALVDDPVAAARASAAAASVRNCWSEAARLGLSHPALREAAAECMTAALDVVSRTADHELAVIVADFAERLTFRGLSPADGAIVARQPQWVGA